MDVTLIGNHFPDPQQILFDKLDIYYSYLPQWAGIFPDREYQKPFDEVRAETEQGIVVVQPLDLSIKSSVFRHNLHRMVHLLTEMVRRARFITFLAKLQPLMNAWSRLTKNTSLIKEADLAEVVRIRCEVAEALSVEKWAVQFIGPLQNLISLATQRPNDLVNIVGYARQDGGDQSSSGTPEIPVQIAYRPGTIPIPTSEPTLPETILFSLQEVSSDFSSVVEEWLRTSDELASVYWLFFGVQYTNLPLDLQYLLIAQAAEVYQDYRFDERATFRNQLRNLVNQTDNELHPLLGNTGEERQKLADVMYNTRNYLTHHRNNLASKAATGTELWYISRAFPNPPKSSSMESKTGSYLAE